MGFDDVVEDVGRGVDALGVAVITVGVVHALALYVRDLVRPVAPMESYWSARRRIVRSVLLGLELLVAADIIRTIVVRPTFTSVGVLALIVLVRTFLSFALETEIRGRPPWRDPMGDAGDGAPPPA
jgi:uncharacterized membrane protein